MGNGDPKRFRTSASLLLVGLLVACGGGRGSASSVPTPSGSATCVADGPNSALLAWMPPTTDTGGMPIALTGFRIFCKTEGGVFQWVATAGPSDTTLVLNSLVDGALTFAVTAVSTDGVESEYSNPQGQNF